MNYKYYIYKDINENIIKKNNIINKINCLGFKKISSLNLEFGKLILFKKNNYLEYPIYIIYVESKSLSSNQIDLILDYYFKKHIIESIYYMFDIFCVDTITEDLVDFIKYGAMTFDSSLHNATFNSYFGKNQMPIIAVNSEKSIYVSSLGVNDIAVKFPIYNRVLRKVENSISVEFKYNNLSNSIKTEKKKTDGILCLNYYRNVSTYHKYSKYQYNLQKYEFDLVLLMLFIIIIIINIVKISNLTLSVAIGIGLLLSLRLVSYSRDIRYKKQHFCKLKRIKLEHRDTIKTLKKILISKKYKCNKNEYIKRGKSSIRIVEKIGELSYDNEIIIIPIDILKESDYEKISKNANKYNNLIMIIDEKEKYIYLVNTNSKYKAFCKIKPTVDKLLGD